MFLLTLPTRGPWHRIPTCLVSLSYLLLPWPSGLLQWWLSALLHWQASPKTLITMSTLLPLPVFIHYSTHSDVYSVPTTHPKCSAKIATGLHVAKSNRCSSLHLSWFPGYIQLSWPNTFLLFFLQRWPPPKVIPDFSLISLILPLPKHLIYQVLSIVLSKITHQVYQLLCSSAANTVAYATILSPLDEWNSLFTHLSASTLASNNPVSAQ